MAKRTKAEQAVLDGLEYILLDVSVNLWVAPDGFVAANGQKDIPPGYTTEVSEAKRVLRKPALQQFVDACNRGSDYKVPLRVVDIVASAMRLDE